MATERADLILRVIVTSLCSLGDSEKESGEKANFSVLKRQKKKLEMGEEVLFMILIVWTLSLPNWTISGSIVTMSDRILLLKLKQLYTLILNITSRPDKTQLPQDKRTENNTENNP